MSTEQNPETRRRQAMWDSLIARGGPINVVPGLLRELGIYGGAQGIWVNKEVTGNQSVDGAGIAVGVLHDGSSYDDDLSDDGVIYHFPNTRRRVPSALVPASMSGTKQRPRKSDYAACRMLITVVAAQRTWRRRLLAETGW